MPASIRSFPAAIDHIGIVAGDDRAVASAAKDGVQRFCVRTPPGRPGYGIVSPDDVVCGVDRSSPSPP
jgi:hypothetical protein